MQPNVTLVSQTDTRGEKRHVLQRDSEDHAYTFDAAVELNLTSTLD